ncbi:hypothetical protein EDC94DRAFT_582263 [Helicostylum pulchrum]|nr:hypothetical protein EDC94DRAFT_582263 [Helicostylum pulchrum]
MIILNTNCWKLRFLPSLGENDMVSVSFYYICTYYSRSTLKKLEVSFGMLSSQDISNLKEFTALKTLEIHKNLISGLNELESLIQFTPNIQELTVRFVTNRVCQTLNVQHAKYSSIKKLCLYNFTPQNNDELLTLVTEFSSVQNLYIFSERDKIWLDNIDNPLTIDKFFCGINSIAKYEIMMPGDTQEIGFSSHD